MPPKYYEKEVMCFLVLSDIHDKAFTLRKSKQGLNKLLILSRKTMPPMSLGRKFQVTLAAAPNIFTFFHEHPNQKVSLI